MEPLPDAEEPTWYTQEETRALKTAMINDARRLRSLLANGRAMTDPEFRDETVGIEKLMSPTVARRVYLRVRAHASTVLAAQGDEDNLCIISQQSSRWSRERAYQVAIIRG